MRKTTKSPGEKIVKDIKRATPPHRRLWLCHAGSLVSTYARLVESSFRVGGGATPKSVCDFRPQSVSSRIAKP